MRTDALLDFLVRPGILKNEVLDVEDHMLAVSLWSLEVRPVARLIRSVTPNAPDDFELIDSGRSTWKLDTGREGAIPGCHFSRVNNAK